VAGRLDAYLDRLARLAMVSSMRRAAAAPRTSTVRADVRADAPADVPAEERLAALLRANDARGLRLFERSAAVEREDAARLAALGEERDAARAEAERLRAELAAARAAVDAVTGSRTWRYTQPLRNAVARARERRR
jgi:hypothetical protein